MSISVKAVVLLALLTKVNCQTCPQNCVQCTDTNSCTECSEGFYNGYLYDDVRHYSRNNCSLECDTRYCEACVSFKNCTKCKAGYCNSGDLRGCKHHCNVNCKACSSCNHCTACKAGYYGSSCNMSCPYDCLDGTCNTQSGSCKCRVNFEGIRCDRCISGKFGQFCQHNCSRGCTHNSCDSNGVCLQGCKTGYIGRSCNSCNNGFYGNECKKCPKNCLTCLSAKYCSECRKEFSGSTCEMSCPLTCSHCDSNGKCSACVPGFYGSNCSSKCPKDCIICNQNGGNCHRCKSGFWGSYCNVTCGPGCSQNKCEKANGSCLNGCKMGFTGVRCEICENGFFGQMCLPCPTTCAECTSETECSRCSVGFYGQTCSRKCSENCDNGLCFGEAGTCQSCKVGFYGDRCQFICPINCAANSCDLDGTCFACKEGFYGDKCETQCSRQCKGSCKRFLGECHHCIDGYFGNNCEENCPKNCINCTSSAQCTFCKTGKKGKICQQDCSNCRIGTQCGKSNGYCYEACADGFYDVNCDRFCHVRCKTCYRKSYFRCSSCPYGKYGEHQTHNYLTCHLDCPLECNENNCSSETGLCLHGCKKGYWGETCKTPCAPTCKMCNQLNGKCLECISGSFGENCLQNCSSYCEGHCEKNRGKCVIGCARKNRYGSFCDNDCSSNCVNKECNWITGHCSSGCVDGYFGSTCENSCSKHCRNSSCSRDSGECNLGCIGGYEEPLCVQEATGTLNTDIIISILAGVFGLVAASILVVVPYIRLHRRKKGKYKDDIAGMKSRSDTEDFLDERETDRGDVEIEDFETGCINALPKQSTKEKPLKLKTDRGVRFMQPEMFAACLTKEVSDEVETIFDDETTKVGAVSFQENTYYNAETVLRRRTELDKLKEFVSKKSKDDFIAEFQELPVGLIKSYEASQKTENRAKNRYRGLYPYDGRRVIIKNGRPDYINASYIDGYMKRNAYIASTGPTVKHMGEDFAIFWEMIWQEHVTKIIMLTKLVELGVCKCDQYWPGEGSCCTYGNVVVTCRKESIRKNFTIRTFDIENLKYEKERRTLCQMHFTSWPDKGIPASVALFTEFHKIANDESITETTDYPILVHCSAGIGRTGTYIALDILTTEGRTEGYVDIFACVRNLREERVNMVQTLEQYVYIHKCLVENLTQNDFKPKQMREYAEEKN